MHRITLPHSSSLQNLNHVLRSCNFFPQNPSGFELVFQPKGSHLQPFVLAMLGAWAHHWREREVHIVCRNVESPWIRYATRMGLFEALGVEPPYSITAHEATGRFIPLVRLNTVSDVRSFMADTVPLLHGQEHPAAVSYCLSELTRNVMEHAGGVPAFACAQYYAKARRVSIGVADTGVGIRESLQPNYPSSGDAEAIVAALTPGISGTTPRMYGSSDNAGAGLFFTKAISQISRGFFVLYSGDAAFRLRRFKNASTIRIYADPERDRHDMFTGVPRWPGTVLGVDVATHIDERFDRVMARIRTVYAARSPRTSKPRIRFT